MSVDCGACCAKYLLSLFNFVFFIAGSIVLTIGIWIAADKASFIEATKIIQSTDAVDGLSQFTQPNVIEQVAYVLIACGAFIFIISFLGYCGAIKESRCLLSCYGIALIVILVIELTAGGLALGYKDKAEEKTRQVFKYTIKKYYTTADKSDGVTLFWNHMMIQLKCCGVDNYLDFDDSRFRKEGNKTVPDACCVLIKDNVEENKLHLKDPRCPYSPSEANSYYMVGCYSTFINLLLDHANVAIVIGIGLALVQLLGIFLAFCLCKSIERSRAQNPRPRTPGTSAPWFPSFQNFTYYENPNRVHDNPYRFPQSQYSIPENPFRMPENPFRMPENPIRIPENPIRIPNIQNMEPARNYLSYFP